ncbi:AI-2E family transporter [Pseudoduganella umbonata]|uniref:AI-2E family transporter n=1 Tax=Pseudoduganella umbonata TaxID=864828 RepID=A0A4P8HPR8_9BURK|nr:AI-2E family transporter [Pseudoduganella umbonata]MBB3221132.1 putative PurR-regulated permease PerM [Pseudoduganella umbonata]QCP10325.1 AI-2E family transporter [Pseudoduganella umbonata]
MKRYTLPQSSFLLLLGVVTLAFFWILLPFSGAVFWGVVFAIVFAPLYAALLNALGNRPNSAALLALLLILLMVIMPLTMIAASLVDQASAVYSMINTGQIDFNVMFQRVIAALPAWALSVLERFELTNIAMLQDKLTAGAAQISQAAARYAINFGSKALDFMISTTVMLYLLFFLFRDGRTLSARIKRAVPLASRYKKPLFDNFITVIRATVKGNVLVAMAQGALGGLIFWLLDVPGPLLWAVVMAFLSLLPAVGAAIIWGPVAIYFLITGSVWQGVVLALYGVLVIGLVDNVLRPILVGKDTKLPDYIVLLSTIGGMALFGLNGFVIGPVIAALFIAAWNLFANADEFHAE